MLDSHPDLAIPPETDFLRHVYPACRDRLHDRSLFIDSMLNHWRWTDCHVDPDEFRAAINDLKPFTLSDGFRSFYRLYARNHGKRRWGDKTPPYLRYMEMIEEVLPEAHFIHIIRDGRDVALSIVPLWFGPNSIEEAAHWWPEQIQLARRQAQALKRYMEIRYEDLLAEPESVLKAVCRFIDLPWNPSMLDYHRRAGERIEEVVRDYRQSDGTLIASAAERHSIHTLLRQPVQTDRAGKWKTEMSEDDRQYFKQVAGNTLRDLGYEV